MVQTFGTDSSNDLYLGLDGNIVILSGIDAVAAACGTKTKAQLGEMVYETSQGVPSLQTVLGVGVPQYPIYQTFLRNNIASIFGVVSIQSIQMNPLKNSLNYTASIKTIYGNTVLNG